MAAKLLDYSMTKGGIHAFTRSLAGHLIPRGIRVNAVAPGPVWTPLNPADKEAQDVAEFGAQTPMSDPRNLKRLLPLTYSWLRRIAPVTSPEKSCRSSVDIEFSI